MILEIIVTGTLGIILFAILQRKPAHSRLWMRVLLFIPVFSFAAFVSFRISEVSYDRAIRWEAPNRINLPAYWPIIAKIDGAWRARAVIEWSQHPLEVWNESKKRGDQNLNAFISSWNTTNPSTPIISGQSLSTLALLRTEEELREGRKGTDRLLQAESTFPGIIEFIRVQKDTSAPNQSEVTIGNYSGFLLQYQVSSQGAIPVRIGNYRSAVMVQFFVFLLALLMFTWIPHLLLRAFFARGVKFR
jgi:hypothetical protein